MLLLAISAALVCCCVVAFFPNALLCRLFAALQRTTTSVQPAAYLPRFSFRLDAQHVHTHDTIMSMGLKVSGLGHGVCMATGQVAHVHVHGRWPSSHVSMARAWQVVHIHAHGRWSSGHANMACAWIFCCAHVHACARWSSGT